MRRSSHSLVRFQLSLGQAGTFLKPDMAWKRLYMAVATSSVIVFQ